MLLATLGLAPSPATRNILGIYRDNYPEIRIREEKIISTVEGMTMKSFLIKLVLSLISICVYGWINNLIYPISVLQSGKAAAIQFVASDSASVWASLSMNFFHNIGWPLAILLVVLVAIWFFPFKKSSNGVVTVGAVIIAGSVGVVSHPAMAFYENSDKTEAYTILPNESAFWIPDTGDNKESQAKLDSAEYLNSHKIAMKRFIVPHHKLSGSGGWSGFDAYVPDGRLIIVDRTTYSREWVKDAARGTSEHDQSFPCQSKDGLNITVGVSIGTSVHEDDAAKYLYNFGVRQADMTNRQDPQVIFQSVYYGRSLAEVMDDVGRKKVQTLVCSEIAKRDFDQANADTNPIMDSITKNAKDYFSSVGITLNFIGWADTFTFDSEVQKAVNDRYIAQTITPALPVLQALAEIRMKEGVAEGVKNHGLPANMIAIPENQIGGFGLGALMNGAAGSTSSKKGGGQNMPVNANNQ
jgi:hypothetical protein